MTVHGAYLEFIGELDPAAGWLAAGIADARFSTDVTATGAVVRGVDDLRELHDIVDDLFGVGAFDRPMPTEGERRSASLVIARPAAVMPFVETLRPQLEGRGPAFWTWKTAREAIALRLDGVAQLTIEAALS